MSGTEGLETRKRSLTVQVMRMAPLKALVIMRSVWCCGSRKKDDQPIPDKGEGTFQSQTLLFTWFPLLILNLLHLT